MEIKVLVWSSRHFIEDCETSEVESWDVLLRLSRETFSCHSILQICREKLSMLCSSFVVCFVA